MSKKKKALDPIPKPDAEALRFALGRAAGYNYAIVADGMLGKRELLFECTVLANAFLEAEVYYDVNPIIYERVTKGWRKVT